MPLLNVHMCIQYVHAHLCCMYTYIYLPCIYMYVDIIPFHVFCSSNRFFQIVTSFLLQWRLHVLRKQVKGPVELVVYLTSLRISGRCAWLYSVHA